MVASGPAAADADGDLDAFTATLDAEIPRMMETYDVPGIVVALVDGGDVVWSDAYGMADIATGRPITTGDVVRAESISKSVTAWGVLRLVEEGRLGLEDRVSDHLGGWRPPPGAGPIDDITIRELLSHTAGLPLGAIGIHYPPGADMPSLRENLSSQVRVVGEPGGSFSYSNVGFDLLEVVVEESSGEPFATYMQHHVLGPLGMERSSFVWNDAFTGSLPTGYDLDGNPIAPYVYPAAASGGLFTTVDDLARFVAAGTTGPAAPGSRVLGRESIVALHSPSTEIGGLFRLVSPAYGLGHFIEESPSGDTVVWHGGQGNGWMTDFHLVPGTGDGIVVVANSQRSWPLIAGVVDRWAAWNGLGTVGFSVIARAQAWLWMALGLVTAMTVGQVGRIVWGLHTGRRRLRPLIRRHRARRLLLAGAAGVAAAIPAWAATQDYLFVSSIFPTGWRWIGAVLLGVAGALTATAVAPVVELQGASGTIGEGRARARPSPS